MTNQVATKTSKLGGFDITEVESGVIFDESTGMYPSKLMGYKNDGPTTFGAIHSTIYGVVKEDDIYIKHEGNSFGPLQKGHYFSIPGTFEVYGTGTAVLFERIGFRGVFNLGGPVEGRGRVSYIDGCSDSLLVYPPRLGDPCFNILWFPENVRQTMHTHPTIRLGFVLYGNGRCVTPEGQAPLSEGSVFRLSEMSSHCFNTDDSPMAIIAYHPDSDWGPTDENHPMLNRTLIQK